MMLLVLILEKKSELGCALWFESELSGFSCLGEGLTQGVCGWAVFPEAALCLLGLGRAGKCG